MAFGKRHNFNSAREADIGKKTSEKKSHVTF